jgi:ribosomal protein S18 acetylase RimI-like enzyme
VVTILLSSARLRLLYNEFAASSSRVAGRDVRSEGETAPDASSRLTRRAAVDADREFARRAHHDAYRDVVMRQFGAWDEAWQDRRFRASWMPDAHEILLWDGVPCGYLGVDERGDDFYVREIVVRPEFQGRGIGTAILQGVIERARQRGLPVRLQALHRNRAIELYRRLGFREVGRTDTHVLFERSAS